ncbi:hypothetical protein HOLleu_07702 [Holothuria leucospilota]|uniref:LRAT domain-containing protein n=1 Tax=Holothuria leucospilota TaxID=206669 RepID=A0A9Q1HFT2_HOLLE|nr:hypothetical protein HOLleu_07702 [Holothuria leucospilota]
MAERLAHAACRNTNAQKFKRYIRKHGGNNQMIGLCCGDCLSEWVSPEFLSNDNDANETITAEGQEFRLMKKRTLAESQFRLQKHHTPFPNHRAAEQCIKAAEHISYKTYKGFIMHHATVKAVKKDENGIRFILIHWKKLGCNNYEVVEDENVNLREKARCIIRCDYPEDYVRADSTELVIARATAWKGETNYGLFSNNCEHFAILQSRLPSKLPAELDNSKNKTHSSAGLRLWCDSCHRGGQKNFGKSCSWCIW